MNEVDRLLQIELQDVQVSQAFTVVCLRNGTIDVRGENGGRMRSFVEASEEHNARTVSLVLGELIRNTVAPSAKPLPPPNKLTVTPANPVATARQERWLMMFGQLAHASARDAGVWGSGLGASTQTEYADSWWGAMALELAADRANATRGLGTARTETLNATLVLAAAKELGTVRVGAGPTLRTGMSRVSGLSSKAEVIAEQAWAPLLAPGFRFESRVSLGRVAPFVSLGFSYDLIRSTGLVEGMRAVRVGGFTTTLQVGVGWNLF